VNDLSPEAKTLLRNARAAFSPSEDRLHAVRAALAGQLAEPAAAPSAKASSGLRLLARLSAWGPGHVVGAAFVAGAIAAGGFAAWQVVSPRMHAASESRSLADTPDMGRPARQAVGEGARALPEMPMSVPSPRLPPDHGEARTPAPPRALHKARAKPDPIRDVPADPASRMVVPSAAVPSDPPELGDSLAEEVALLREARTALDEGDAPGALHLLDAHASRFPRGTLYEERLVTRVTALCLLGRVDGARVAAEELERARPRSPHLTRVRASCIARPLDK
jgi:hypothetical protein